jgi:ABC-type oligopeptide transport system substrate-binding subunit
LALGRRLPLAPLFLVLLVLALAACGGGSKTQAAQQTTTDAAGCRSVTPPAAKPRTESKPTKRLDPAKTYDVLIATNCGSFTIRLA